MEAEATRGTQVTGLASTVVCRYSLAKKIKLVGEVGLGYAYTTYAFNGQTYGQHDTVHSIGSRGALGLNLYF